MSDWELYLDGNVVVAEFREGMPSEASEYQAVNEQFEELATEPHVNAHLSLLKMDASLSRDVFEKAKEAAEVGVEYGITDWVCVSDDIKSMALGSQVGEIEGVDTYTAESYEEAIELVGE